MKTIIWIIAVIAFQAIVSALAKRAEKRRMEYEARTSASPDSTTASEPGGRPSTPPTQPPTQKPTVLARGAAKRSKTGAKSKHPPAPPRAPTPKADARGGDSADALLSRQHLAERLARVKEAEARVAAASGIKHGKAPTAIGRPKPAVTASEIAVSVRNPREVRKALIVGEILGRPRSERGF